MATWLEEYTQLKTVAEQKIGSAQLTTSEMLGYQEVLYRIEVLEACKMFSKTAPVTTGDPLPDGGCVSAVPEQGKTYWYAGR